MTDTKSPPREHAGPPAEDHPTNPAGDTPAGGLAAYTASELLTLSVQRPATGVRVVAVEGELDALTAPLLNTCIHEHLVGSPPTHLILDLEPVRFLGSTGLTCLLDARELAQQTPGTQLHLAGLVTPAVARPLQVTELLALFNTYPTVSHALAALSD